MLEQELVSAVYPAEEKLLEYAKDMIKPFTKSHSRRLTSTELNEKGLRPSNYRFIALVRTQLIEKHTLQGSHPSESYTVYEVTNELAERLGINTKDLRKG